jgi:Gpi18-like mannosyltransferase
VSIVLRAPVVAVADALGAGLRGDYQLGSLACMLPVAVVALVVTRQARARRQPFYATLAFVVIFCAAGPVFRALAFGHPEEPLIGALAVATILAAAAARPGLALLLLSLATATKPTAILAAAPAFIALPAERRGELIRRIAPALGVVVVALVAGALVVKSKTLELLDTGKQVRYPSVWYPFGMHKSHVVFDGVEWRVVTERTLPAWFGKVTHVVILLLIVPASFLQARFGRQTLAAAMALLALLMLLRCVLDPVSNVYYHVPFVMALAAWELLDRPGLPVVTIFGATALYVTLYGGPSNGMSLPTANILYLAVAGILSIILVAALSPKRDERLGEAG